MYRPYAPRLAISEMPPAAAVQRAALPHASERPSGAADACLRALERIEQVVDQETLALQRHARSDLGDFNARKSHALLELSRAMKGLDRASAGAALAPQLAVVREKLGRNGAVLRMHIEAVGEVSAMMAGALRDAESDGTYSAALRFRRGQ